MIPAVLAGLVGGVINAWLFLVRVPARSAEPDGTARTAILRPKPRSGAPRPVRS